ncbi:hypothetical protein FACS1894122_11760 [Alphaproteobacteria bacterium]|nr:hypothetical protein FACS1894122_11760 [Alphaproteobacteria bacterium]
MKKLICSVCVMIMVSFTPFEVYGSAQHCSASKSTEVKHATFKPVTPVYSNPTSPKPPKPPKPKQ